MFDLSIPMYLCHFYLYSLFLIIFLNYTTFLLTRLIILR